jgi:hypothetical protein
MFKVHENETDMLLTTHLMNFVSVCDFYKTPIAKRVRRIMYTSLCQLGVY